MSSSSSQNPQQKTKVNVASPDPEELLAKKPYSEKSFRNIIPQWKNIYRGWTGGALSFAFLMTAAFGAGPLYVYFMYGEQWDTFGRRMLQKVEGKRVSMWNRRNQNATDTYYTQRPVDYKAYAGGKSYDIAGAELLLNYPVWDKPLIDRLLKAKKDSQTHD